MIFNFFFSIKGRGIISTYYSEDGGNYLVVYLHRGNIHIIVRDNNSEKEIKLTSVRVDDGEPHVLDIHCESAGYIIAYIDQDRQMTQNHVRLESPLYFSGYTIGYFNAEKLSPRYASLDCFHGCIEQITLNKECLVYENAVSSDRSRLSCPVQPASASNQQQTSPLAPAQANTWHLKGGLSAGEIEFIPYLSSQARQAELSFKFNTSRADAGTIMCTRDDQLAVKVELKDQKLLLSVYEAKSRRFLKAVTCQSARSGSFSDNKWHRVQLVKKSRGSISISCDEGAAQTLSYDGAGDLPFVNTNNGVKLGSDCVDDSARSSRKFIGELSQINYIHDERTYDFDDLQYSEDPRLNYKNYVEFRPRVTSDSFVDPKPLHFRSGKSSARLDRWDPSKLGRLRFEFKADSTGDNGVIFSTESVGAYFAVSLNDGFLETTLSPQRVPLTEYDRYQRLFHDSESRINDNEWHKLEFTMLGDGLGLFRLDDDESTKVRFPISYWTEESALVFGNNVDLKSTDGSGFNANSFKGCLRNVYANNRLINWQTTGVLNNIEVGCYSTRASSASNQNGGDESDANIPFIKFEKGGCLRYTPPKTLGSERETIELQFKTSGDQLVLLDSTTSDFIIHTQGPALVVRSKDDSTVSATVLGSNKSFIFLSCISFQIML
jgi:hypothetical protein